MATNTPTKTRSKRAAWGIHVFTASGVLCGLMGLLSVLNDSPTAALVWLMVALVIDGIDGPFARRIDCRLHVPNIDGMVLDLVIDYVTCVVTPAVFLDRFGLMPKGFSLLAAGLIMLTALYPFSRTDLMTDDHYFRGFPAMWNLVVNALFLMNFSVWMNFAVVVVFAALSLSNVLFPHPVQVRESRNLTLMVTAAWLSLMTAFTLSGAPTPVWGSVALLAGVLYFAWLTVRRTGRVRQPSASLAVAD